MNFFWRFYQHFPSSSQVPELCPRTLQPLEQAQSPKKQRNPASERPMPKSTKNNASVAFIVVFYKLVKTGLEQVYFYKYIVMSTNDDIDLLPQKLV